MMLRYDVSTFFLWLDPFFLWYFGTINIIFLLVLILGSIRIYLRYQEVHTEDFTSILQSNSLPEISFITPFYNEAHHMESKISNLLSVSYRYKEIILVNDGSTDHTMDMLKTQLDLVPVPKIYQDRLPTKPVRAVYRSKLHPELFVIDKEHGTKFDTVNAGLNAASNYFFIVTDAGTWVDDEGFQALIRPLLTHPDTVAVGASVRIKNGCDMAFNRISTKKFPATYLAAMQGLEYLRCFIMRDGWDMLKGNFVISGAFSIFPRELMIAVGGFCPSVAEDMEIIIRLTRIMKYLKMSHRIFYVPDPIAWTEGPSTLKALGRQRSNWHRGMTECLWYHKGMMLNPRYGFFGMVVYPFWFLAEVIEPIVEILGFCVIFGGWSLGILNISSCVLLLCVTFVFMFIFTVACLFIEELSFKKYSSLSSLVKLLLYNFIDNIGYRQMNLLWRFRGFIHFCKRFKKVREEGRLIKRWVEKAIKQGRL